MNIEPVLSREVAEVDGWKSALVPGVLNNEGPIHGTDVCHVIDLGEVEEVAICLPVVRSMDSSETLSRLLLPWIWLPWLLCPSNSLILSSSCLMYSVEA
jgi:hypothetical protein